MYRQMKIADVKEGTVAESVCNKFKAAAVLHIVIKGADLRTQSIKQNMFWILNTLSLRWWWDCRISIKFIIFLQFIIFLHEDMSVLLRKSEHVIISELDVICVRMRVIPYGSAIKVSIGSVPVVLKIVTSRFPGPDETIRVSRDSFLN